MSAPCRRETKAFRQCLHEKRSSGRKCDHLAKKLEACRVQWRKANRVQHTFDGTRVLPAVRCRPLSDKVQSCLRVHGGKEAKCKRSIERLRVCMAETAGVVAEPTAGDKLWSDYKQKQKLKRSD